MRALKVRGGNISMSNKVTVMQYLDRISPKAEMCGAVNMIVNDGGILTGYMMDGIGFIGALEDKGIRIRRKKITVAETGGVGKTIEVQD